MTRGDDQGLNYDIEHLTDQSSCLKDTSDGHERAVAMFLQEDESFDHTQERFVGQSPVAYALNEADKRNLEYVIGSSGDTLRLYTTNPDAGFGSRGRTDTYVEVNTSLLADEKAAYLWLLFSANAPEKTGRSMTLWSDRKTTQRLLENDSVNGFTTMLKQIWRKRSPCT